MSKIHRGQKFFFYGSLNTPVRQRREDSRAGSM